MYGFSNLDPISGIGPVLLIYGVWFEYTIYLATPFPGLVMAPSYFYAYILILISPCNIFKIHAL